MLLKLSIYIVFHLVFKRIVGTFAYRKLQLTLIR